MNNSELDISKDVWCVLKYGDTEFYKIYTDKEEAEKIAAENNKSAEKVIFYNSKVPKCEVKSVADAIWWIKEAMEDQQNMDEFYNVLTSHFSRCHYSSKDTEGYERKL